jgi:hypothetical protein
LRGTKERRGKSRIIDLRRKAGIYSIVIKERVKRDMSILIMLMRLVSIQVEARKKERNTAESLAKKKRKNWKTVATETMKG